MFVLVGTLGGCVGDDDMGATPPAERALHGKCAFITRSDSQLLPGDVFVYVMVEVDSGRFTVVTGEASTRDDLEDRTAILIGTLMPARVVGAHRLEFGGLSEARDEVADHFLNIGNTSGEVHISIGGTYGTELAYPRCAFWGVE